MLMVVKIMYSKENFPSSKISVEHIKNTFFPAGV